ncbi:hypothetical protein CRYUN_Cryun02cG0051200 [Craigia yunnanensis]
MDSFRQTSCAILHTCKQRQRKNIGALRISRQTSQSASATLSLFSWVLMAVFTPKWSTARFLLMTFFCSLFLFVLVSGARSLQNEALKLNDGEETKSNNVLEAMISLWRTKQSGYQHVWPELKFGWQIVAGTVIGFFGAAFGSVGGVGGGGIFVPMLNLVIGFDQKSSTAISKCMIMGAAASTVYYNLRQRHPRLNMPMIDYDLVLIIQPMLMLGISIGVTFNVIFPDWTVTILLILLCTGTSVKAYFKGVETWKRETVLKQEAAKLFESCGELIHYSFHHNRIHRSYLAYIYIYIYFSQDTATPVVYKNLPGGPSNKPGKEIERREATILENIRWKELGLLSFVWFAYLAVQIAKNYTATCSTSYWALNLLQIPVSVGVYLYEAIGLYKGWRVIASKGDEGTNWKVYQLVLCCACGLVAGIIGGLLGIGGGFVMGPLFLELGIPPQVSSATATFGMTFSSSMSVVEYYLLNRFPVPYALYSIAVSIIAALIGQHIVNKLINLTGRESIIIFVLAFIIFVSAISLGGVGISSMIEKIEHNEYMGFENLCKYEG